jgi:hypothetical protein
LWAAISVQNPVFPKIRAYDLAITFAIVNDGRTPVNPGLGSSRLSINGVELHDWHMIVANGPCTSFCEALPPGRTLLFSKGLGNYFKKPGGLYSAMGRPELQNTRSDVEGTSR